MQISKQNYLNIKEVGRQGELTSTLSQSLKMYTFGIMSCLSVNVITPHNHRPTDEIAYVRVETNEASHSWII